MGITVYNEAVDGEVVVVNSSASLINSVISGLMGELNQISKRKYLATIREYLEYVEGNPQSQPAVSFSNYLGWLRDKGLNGSTINVKRVEIRRFYEWAAKVGLVGESDYIKVKSVKTTHTSGSKRGNWLTKNQLRCLLEAPDRATIVGRRDRAILSILIGCGMRRDEITHLKWNQLIRQGNVWIFQNVSRKHGRMQGAIVVPAFVKTALDEYNPEGKGNEYILVSYDRHGNARDKMTAQTVYNTVRKYTAQCGFDGIAPHDLRRSWARSAKDSGLELSQIQLTMGHESITTTQHYVNEIMDLEAIANAVDF